MIQFQNVTKRYANHTFAVKDIDLTIDEGEFVFLIGPSGSGKTTLIKMLIRDEKPSEGKIFFDDTDITRISRGKIYKLRRKIGVIFQDYKLIPDKTSYENVAFAMEASGKSNKEIKERVPYLLDVVGLTNKFKSFPAQLSGGEQQRVAIARAIANNPQILIADEPTGNLDPASAWDIVQILTKINSWGTTVIMSTHGTEIVNSLNKRVIQMQGGSILRDDAEGEYEFITTSKLPFAIEKPEKKKKKKAKKEVNINLKNEEVEIKPEKKSKLKFKFFNKKPKEEENFGEKLNLEIKKQHSLTDEKVEPVEIAEETLQEKYNTTKFVPISFLNLPKKILNSLKDAGYQKISDLIDDGPEVIGEKLKIDVEEVKLIAKAIEKSLIS